MPQPPAQIAYSTINHDGRRKLGLTWIEYGLIDSIYKLSTKPQAPYNGWCIASKRYLAKFLDISERETFSIIQKGVTLGLIEKHPETKHLKTTALWFDTIQLSASAQNADPMQDVQGGYAQIADQGYAQIADYKEIDNKEIDNGADRSAKPGSAPKTPAPYVQLIEHIAQLQGVDFKGSFSSQTRAAIAILKKYTLEEAKMCAEILLEEQWWRDTGLTAPKLLNKIDFAIKQAKARIAEREAQNNRYYGYEEYCHMLADGRLHPSMRFSFSEEDKARFDARTDDPDKDQREIEVYAVPQRPKSFKRFYV